MKKIILTIIFAFVFLITITSSLALTKIAIEKEIIEPIEPIIIEQPKADIANIAVQNIIMYQAIANNWTKIGFEVKNNNVDAVTINVRVQPGDGVSDIVYSNINLNPGQLIVLNPKWIYTSSGTKNTNIRVEYNSQIKDTPFTIDVISLNQYVLSGIIKDGNSNGPIGTTADISFGLERTQSNSNGIYTFVVQSLKNYFMVTKAGYYKWSQQLTINSNIEKNITLPIRFNTTVLGEDGLYFMKFMTNTFNPEIKTIFVSQKDTDLVYNTLISNEKINSRDKDVAGLSENDIIYTEYVGKMSKASGILTTWKDLPIKVYYNRSGAPSMYVENLTAALNNWSNAAGKPGTMFIESTTPISLSDKGINFFYPTSCPNGGMGETYPINSSPQGDITNVNICIRTNLGSSTYKIFAHELGHGIGLWSHSDDLTHLMKAGAGRDITTDEATMIKNLYNIPSLTNMDNYKIGYVNTYLKNILIYSHNSTHYNFTDRFYSAHYTDMIVCRDIACTNCNIYDKSNCVCYKENIAPSPSVGTFITGTCQYPKTSTDPLYTKVCDKDTGFCSKMCNLQALNC